MGETFQDSNPNTGLKQPDYSFCLRGHCVFWGEEESPKSNIDPKNELLQTFKWSYDPLPFILSGLYTSSLTITDNPISRLCCHWMLGLTQYDIQATMQIHHPCHSWSCRCTGKDQLLCAHTPHFCYTRWTRRSTCTMNNTVCANWTVCYPFLTSRQHWYHCSPNGVFIEFGEDMVKKRFMENIYQSLCHHKDIYKEFKQKNVCYMDQWLKAHDDYILTSPVRDSWPLEMGKAAYTAITCVLKALMVVVFLIYGWYLTFGSENAHGATSLPLWYLKGKHHQKDWLWWLVPHWLCRCL